MLFQSNKGNGEMGLPPTIPTPMSPRITKVIYFEQHCTNFLSSKIFILRFALSLEGNTYKVLSFWFAIMHAYVFKTVIHVYIVCVCVRVQQTLGSIKLIYTVMFCVLNKVCVSMYIVIICEIAQCFLIKGI